MKQIDPLIDLGCTIWKTDKCFYCGGVYELDYWYNFEKIGNRLYQVPCCNKCSAERDKNFTGEKYV